MAAKSSRRAAKQSQAATIADVVLGRDEVGPDVAPAPVADPDGGQGHPVARGRAGEDGRRHDRRRGGRGHGPLQEIPAAQEFRLIVVTPCRQRSAGRRIARPPSSSAPRPSGRNGRGPGSGG
ncbi:MAG: hypothetical protein MZV64_64545 [Ignavibacteriales bacterium]|nr:hypothetical protein [Ignavibacteriales bacterium]